jgi:1H-pyrrole-2-carbonyl-[peptidyl-carrier protein] chlorinase
MLLSSFNQTIQLNPILNNRMKKAEQLRDFQMDGNYSYSLDNFVGNGWLAIGDAAFFVDPIFSSGISLAMHSAKFASEAIIGGLAANDLSQSYLKRYEEQFKVGTQTWRQFVRLFYEASPIFCQVIAESEYRIEALQICEGEVFDLQASKTVSHFEKVFSRICSTPNHPLNSKIASYI